VRRAWSDRPPERPSNPTLVALVVDVAGAPVRSCACPYCDASWHPLSLHRSPARRELCDLVIIELTSSLVTAKSFCKYVSSARDLSRTLYHSRRSLYLALRHKVPQPGPASPAQATRGTASQLLTGLFVARAGPSQPGTRPQQCSAEHKRAGLRPHDTSAHCRGCDVLDAAEHGRRAARSAPSPLHSTASGLIILPGHRMKRIDGRPRRPAG
jgi:hypothetical protein